MEHLIQVVLVSLLIIGIDATRETLKTFGSDVGGWYGDTSYFPNGDITWFARGGRGISYNDAGIFNFHTGPEQTYEWDSFRIVLTAQDGNE